MSPTTHDGGYPQALAAMVTAMDQSRRGLIAFGSLDQSHGEISLPQLLLALANLLPRQSEENISVTAWHSQEQFALFVCSSDASLNQSELRQYLSVLWSTLRLLAEEFKVSKAHVKEKFSQNKEVNAKTDPYDAELRAKDRTLRAALSKLVYGWSSRRFQHEIDQGRKDFQGFIAFLNNKADEEGPECCSKMREFAGKLHRLWQCEASDTSMIDPSTGEELFPYFIISDVLLLQEDAWYKQLVMPLSVVYKQGIWPLLFP
ncbi:hypothetical protein NLJ89_g1181 [Agrocybe chaxingu]|uniref:Uncharacterized protein n=1 Tax=Agrocybe chaxingu TaxID=84603 RepID=A0A9W8N0L0_9AGAR|nr:hypothetical protein NLJ89_g1181 [Agrocybe chaxingu]